VFDSLHGSWSSNSVNADSDQKPPWNLFVALNLHWHSALRWQSLGHKDQAGGLVHQAPWARKNSSKWPADQEQNYQASYVGDPNPNLNPKGSEHFERSESISEQTFRIRTRPFWFWPESLRFEGKFYTVKHAVKGKDHPKYLLKKQFITAFQSNLLNTCWKQLEFKSVLRIRIRDPVHLDPWIRDPE
jgi:hypothetical protein